MNLGDFSSVVQLGVGLHAGTALLQAIAEFGAKPLSGRLTRLQSIAKLKAAKNAKYCQQVDDLRDIVSDLDLKTVQFFNEYKVIVIGNAAVALILCIVLALCALFAETSTTVSVGFLIILLSFGPAGFSILFLAWRWKKNTVELAQKIEQIEQKLLGIPLRKLSENR